MKSPEWPFDDLDLTSPESCIKFLAEMVRYLWTGELGSRAGGTIRGAVDSILRYHTDVKRLAELEVYFSQVKALVESNDSRESIILEFVKGLPAELRQPVLEHVNQTGITSSEE
jgi:hypothetical protein